MPYDELTYPAAREREPVPPATGADRYKTYQAIVGAAGTGGVMAELGRFAGTPDAIDLVSTGGDALVELTDELFSEESSLRLVVGVPIETRISRRVVRAVNVSDASQATVRAIAKWLG